MSSQIFMGNGDHSMAECYQLHLKLDKALNLISGMQQMGEGPQVTYDDFEVKLIAIEIYTKLTGAAPKV